MSVYIRFAGLSVVCLLLSSIIGQCQVKAPSCKEVKNGFFYWYPVGSKSTYTSDRTNGIQKQVDITTHDTTTFKVRWTDECSYFLEHISGSKKDPAMKAMDSRHKMLVQIVSVTPEYYVYKMYYDQVSNDDFGSDTMWRKAKAVDTRVFDEKDHSEAEFPGGTDAWNDYMTKVLKKHINALVKDNVTGTCYVAFIVDTNGKVSQVEALSMEDTKLAKVCVDAIRNGPKWIPPMKDGKPLKAYRIQPVTFNIQDGKDQ